MHAAQSRSGNRDQAFIDMMHDCLETSQKALASTESVTAVAEKHMTKQSDLQQNGGLDWCFHERGSGTQIPHYSFKYDLASQPGNKTRVKVEVTQSEVDQNFAMFVPVFADFGKGMVRIGQVGVIGSGTRAVIFHMDSKPKKVAINVYKDVLER